MAKMIKFLFFVLLSVSNSFKCYAAACPETVISSRAPLGSVWVRDLEGTIKEPHLRMVRKELEEMKSVDIHTNIALFELNIFMQDGTCLSVLDQIAGIFKSGGHMLTEAAIGKVSDAASHRKRLRDDLTTKEEVLRKARQETTRIAGKAVEDLKSIEESKRKFGQQLDLVVQRSADVQQQAQLVKQLDDEEEQYEPRLFSDNRDQCDGYRNSVYDPEQTITRIVDSHIGNATVSEYAITINSKEFLRKSINYIVLNLHTRTDMCPFCLMFLAHKMKEWQVKMSSIPFIVIVTSRQEYRCDYPFIKDKPYYLGYSMRSFGWRSGDDGTSHRGIQEIAREGLVIQYAFQPWEVYGEKETLAA